METRNITFSQTQTILNGFSVPGVTLDDIQAVLNMRDAWRYLVKAIDEPFTLSFICKLNEYVARNEALAFYEPGATGFPERIMYLHSRCRARSNRSR